MNVMSIKKIICIVAVVGTGYFSWLNAGTVTNPIIWADVPDVSMVRVDGKYYMSSTTMHMVPGVPVMESEDMVNWKTVSYCYDMFVNNDRMNLSGGEDAYGSGTWASSLRYKDGTFYVLTFSSTSGSSHLFTTRDPQSGEWDETVLPFWHDPSLLLDDDGRNYVLYGGGDIRIVELNSDLTGVKSGGLNRVILSDPASVAGSGGLRAEGTQVYKHNGYYYIFNICWPSGSMRTQICSRGESLEGSFEQRVVLEDKGVAQGSVLEMENGDWMGYLFQDNGSVGRSPWLVPVTWENDWPVFNNGTAPESFDMASVSSSENPGIVTSDEFSDETLKLEWQFNHNPDNTNWSLTERPDYYRITTGRVDNVFTEARNSLTQRAFGPTSSGRVSLDTKGLKDGDYAGIAALQKKYGFVGVERSGGSNSIVMVNAASGSPIEEESVSLSQDVVYLRIDMDFTNRTDKATFFYSLDGSAWESIGNTLQMSYDMPHFMGYRFALFNFATQSAGGVADFDWFHVGSSYQDVISIEDGSRLTVNTTGQGTVTRDPGGTVFEEGTSVSLTAEPDQGWEFVSWSGEGISSSESTIDITMDSDKTISVLFARSPDEEGNYVLNGDFSSDADNWTLNVWDGDASGGVVDGEYQISIGSTASESYQIQLVQSGLYLENGKTYQVSFDAYAESARELEVNVEMAEDPWDSYLPELEYFDLTTENQRYSFTFTMNAETDVNGRLSFNAGSEVEDVYIDNISLKEYSTSISSSKNINISKGINVTFTNNALDFDLSSYKNKSADLRIYSLRGELVRAASLRKGSEFICDLKGIAEGIYIVNVNSLQNTVWTGKIMIKN